MVGIPPPAHPSLVLLAGASEAPRLGPPFTRSFLGEFFYFHFYCIYLICAYFYFMFIDEIKFHIKTGRGGDGVVRWLHLKGKEFSGPAGGNGGRVGDVYVRAVRDIGLLSKYRHTDKFEAENGESGKSKSQHGKNGEDLFVNLPIGSVVSNIKTGKKVELLKEDESIQILSGGNGGLGNEHFKSSTNINPKECTKGKLGEEADFQIELEMVADAGFVGFPNAGKSSLLNALTKARAKVGQYQFTTLDPNLGDFYGFILADIPGLIEGASEGKGLGHKFLRHIKRTKIILHCLSFENEDLKKAYDTIRKELGAFGGELLEKKEVIILTKTDLVDAEVLEKAKKELTGLSEHIFSVSIFDDESIKNLSDNLASVFQLSK